MLSWWKWSGWRTSSPLKVGNARVRQRSDISDENVNPIFRVGKLHGRDMFEITIQDLTHAFAAEHFTSQEYVHFCLDRIQKIDNYLEAIIEVNPEALSIAAGLDEERSKGRVRGPLHGVPVLVKDNMATMDRMQTTAGSWALLGSIVPRDASIVSQLRDAGAVIIGHANMSEWACMRSSKYSSAYSPRRGEVRNPYDLAHSAYGSSAGSAVSVAANVVPLSFGTETDSSIIGPSFINGVVGIKPTVGLTSRSGVIPISEHMDTIGSFGRSVLDAVLGLNAIVKPDSRDPATLNPARIQEADYTSFMASKSVLKGARFGLPWKRCWEFVREDHRKLAQEILDAIEEAGGNIVWTDFPCWEERIPEDGNWDMEYGGPGKSEFSVAAVDAYNGITEYLSQCTGTEIKRFEDIIKYHVDNKGNEGADPGDHPAFPSGQDWFNRIAATKGRRDEDYWSALKYIQRKSRDEGIDGALVCDGPLDALLLCDERGIGMQMAAQAGYPIICVPIGVDSCGIPVGISIHQTSWKEADLVKWASAIEDLRNDLKGWRSLPTYQNYRCKNIPVFE